MTRLFTVRAGLLAALLLPGWATAAGLNDTGITQCADGSSNNVPCNNPSFPRQDAETGRDAQAGLSKAGAGPAGFDFTKLDSTGQPLADSAPSWDCVRDNVTGLVWEIKTDDGGLRDKDWTYTWYNPDPNTNGGSAGSTGGATCGGFLIPNTTKIIYYTKINWKNEESVMCRVFNLEVLESPEELEEMLRSEKDVRKRERLQFLYWYRTGQAITRKALGKLLHRSQFSIGQWANTYRKEGLKGLLKLNYRGGNLAPSIPLEIQAQLREKLAQPEGFSGYKEIQIWLKETHELDIPYSTVHGTVKYRLKASLKVPRPYAVDYDPVAVEDFKKAVPTCLEEILTPCLTRYSRIRYWTQDESRFGLKTITRRRLTLKKVKALVKNQWQFKAFYLYGVVEPLTGELMIQDYDRVNTENFQKFLNDFSQKYPKDFHVIQTDNASFHRSQDLEMPDNVMLIYQPPHSPQVNSSERLWQWSKGQTANKVFDSLDSLKATLKELFLSKPKAFFSSLTHRNFIIEALQKIGMIPANP